ALCGCWACCRRSSVHCGHSAARSAVRSGSEGLDYCPYDLSDDPAEFGLVRDRLSTRFGQMLVLRSPERRTDEATLLLHGVGATWTTWTPLLRAAGDSTAEMVL